MLKLRYLASPCPKTAVSCYEWCNFPINLNSPTLSCPDISIPQAGVNPHALFVWVSNPFIFVVAEYANWHTINIPPESAVIYINLGTFWIIKQMDGMSGGYCSEVIKLGQ